MTSVRFLFCTLAIACLMLPASAQAQDETLADIRQELSFLHVEIQRLKRELSTTGQSNITLSAGQGISQRLDSLEGELRRVTGKVEELEFRIDRVVTDGTNRIGDLEFRLVELEGGDVSLLGETTTLGGEDIMRTPDVVVDANNGVGELAVSEQVDFERAQELFQEGDYESAAEHFAAFVETYPGGPLSSDAHYWRGESLANLGQWNKAARSFLESFSGAPKGALAPRALFRLGVSLDRIGQTDEACLTLNEVGIRYPESDVTLEAQAEMRLLECG